MPRGTAAARVSRVHELLAPLAVGLVCLAGCGRQDDSSPPHTPAEPEVWQRPVCIGAEPPQAAWSAEPGGESVPADGGGLADVAPALGSLAPRWALRDFQPQSCGYEGVYGLEAFRGVVTVVAVWSGS
jgi:hypothetical protein